MNSLNLDGKHFVKASSLARDLGYTADYVGQLARAGKIEAHLVGRTWYVLEAGLRDYKQGKTRSNKKTTAKALKKTLAESSEPSVVNKVRIKTKDSLESEIVSPKKPKLAFYDRARTSNVKYEEDTSDLIPILKKSEGTMPSKRLGVKLAGAENLDVKTTESPYWIEFTEKPEIRFKGKLKLTEIKEEKASAPSSKAVKEKSEVKPAQSFLDRLSNLDNKPLQTVPSNNTELEPKDNAEAKNKTTKAPLKHTGVIGMKRQVNKSKKTNLEEAAATPTKLTVVSLDDPIPVSRLQPPATPPVSTGSNALKSLVLVRVAGLLLVIAAAIGVIGFERTVVYTSGVPAAYYSFDPNQLVGLLEYVRK